MTLYNFQISCSVAAITAQPLIETDEKKALFRSLGEHSRQEGGSCVPKARGSEQTPACQCSRNLRDLGLAGHSLDTLEFGDC
jgi:hypothetical protein